MAVKAAASIPNWPGSAFLEGKSPALVRDVARQAALLPYAVARAELLEHGLNLDIKEVHNISVHRGPGGHHVSSPRTGVVSSGPSCRPADGQGKRFGAMIDGGRVKLRRTTRRQKGRGKSKTQKRRFKTMWREVKQIIVFEMDEQGRMKKGSAADFRRHVPGTR